MSSVAAGGSVTHQQQQQQQQKTHHAGSMQRYAAMHTYMRYAAAMHDTQPSIVIGGLLASQAAASWPCQALTET
jgi:hypothetical protein